MDEDPIYESDREIGNFWQRYLVFRDRVQLRTMFGVFDIPFSEIVSLQRCPPLLKSMKAADFTKASAYRTIKVDWADMREHVQLMRREGVIRGFAFTPSDIDGFLAAVEGAANRAGVRKFE